MATHAAGGGAVASVTAAGDGKFGWGVGLSLKNNIMDELSYIKA
ncbi:hypothetical protein [Botryobacter ruber]|nr:hypothetical protein [Botryobacter ruber]